MTFDTAALGAAAVMMSIVNVDPECLQLDSGLRRRGVLILTTFALGWAMAGSTGPADPTVGRVLFAATAALVVLVGMRAVRVGWLPPISRQRQLVEDWLRRFSWIVAAEAVGIAAAVSICLAAGAMRALPAAVSLVVGAHFLPLARTFDQPQYRWTGWLLLLLAVAGLLTTTAGATDAGVTIVGFGSALILGGTALHVLVRG